MRPRTTRLALALALVATLVASTAAQDASARRAPPLTSPTSRSVSDGVAATRARDAPADGVGTRTALREAPRVAVRGELRLCGGQPLPPSLFTSETICVEQSLFGVTAENVRRKSLDVTSVDVFFAGHAVDARFIRDPRLVVHGADGAETEARGLFDWLGGTDARGEADAAGDDAGDDASRPPPDLDASLSVSARFELDVAGAFEAVTSEGGATPASTGGVDTREQSERSSATHETNTLSGTLESVVAVQPAGRYYYEIVWYELSTTVPTFYEGAVHTIIEEGEKLGKPQDYIDYEIDNLVSHDHVFFPCTNFIAGPFCEEEGISA